MKDENNLIDLSLYKLFYLVSQNKSFSKTAELLGITQPSISYSIKKLEDELGVSLFERGNGLVLTPEGEELLPYVEEALNTLYAGEKKVNDLINLKKGQISIGIPSHIGVFLLTDIMKKFNQEYPNIRFKVTCKPTKELFNSLNLNELDLLIDCSPLEDNIHDFIVKRITKEKCAFACNKKDKDLLDRVVSLKELNDKMLIVPLKTSSNTKFLTTVFEKRGLVLDPDFEITTSDMIAEMVDQEIGVGYLFQKTIEKYPNLRKIDVDCKLPEFDIFLIYKDSLLSTATKNFIDFVTKRYDIK